MFSKYLFVISSFLFWHSIPPNLQESSHRTTWTPPSAHISSTGSCALIRVAEVVRGHGGPRPKSLDSDKNFKPELKLFCRKLRFVAIYALFGDLWAK